MSHFLIPAGHPALAGHFPGRPIVPAVVLLDEVLALSRQRWPDLRLAGVASAKFLAPLLPQQRCDCELLLQAAGRVDFVCSVAGQPVARGSFSRIQPPGPDSHG